MTAELAIALPAVLLVLAACLGGLRLGVAQVQAVDAAASAARVLARGDTRAYADRVVAATTTAAITAVQTSVDSVCVEVEAQQPVFGLELALPVAEHGCALRDLDGASGSG